MPSTVDFSLSTTWRDIIHQCHSLSGLLYPGLRGEALETKQWHGNSCGLIVRNDQPSWQGLPTLQHSCKQPTPILTYQGTFRQGVAARNVHVGSTSQPRFFRQRPLAELARFDTEGPGPPQTNPGTWNAPTTSSAGDGSLCMTPLSVRPLPKQQATSRRHSPSQCEAWEKARI